MKTINKLWIAMMVLCAAGVGPGAERARANLEVSAGVTIHAVGDFEAPLRPHGEWIDVRQYGRCFRPAGVARDWRPYCEGEWEWTDCGWYWDSDEPWGWACYHYGTWYEDPEIGWVWVPGVDWAPAWVDWRYGGGFVGWAPCAPPGVAITPAWFMFVSVGRFHDRIRRDDLVFNDHGIFNRTERLGVPRREERHFDGRERTVFFDHGPDVGKIQRLGGYTFEQVPVRDAVSRALPRREPAEHGVTPLEHPNVPEVRPREERPPEEIRPDVVRPEGVRPEGVRPEGPRPEGVKPESARPEGVKPEGVRPEEHSRPESVPIPESPARGGHDGGERQGNDGGHGDGGGHDAHGHEDR